MALPDQKMNRLEQPRLPAEKILESGPEQGREQQVERAAESFPIEKKAETAAPAPAQSPSAVKTYRLKKTVTMQRIEHIMEEGLKQVYAEMPAQKQKEFRDRGESVAKEVETLLHQVKVQTKKIFKLIFDWLKMIPGLNKFFLEQEAKLKTDEILRLKEEMLKNKTF